MSESIEIPKPARKPKAASKVAETAPETVISVNIQEAVVPVDNNVIAAKTTNAKVGSRKSNIRTVENNAIGSFAADIALQKFKVTETIEKIVVPEDKIALLSERNIRWDGISISKGYNIVTKEAADKWLTLPGIRIATPEEIITHYSK
jgi:uncharacterized protein YaiL (DUF2058 family)